MFKRKALEKLQYWKEKRHQSILCFWRGSVMLKSNFTNYIRQVDYT